MKSGTGKFATEKRHSVSARSSVREGSVGGQRTSTSQERRRKGGGSQISVIREARKSRGTKEWKLDPANIEQDDYEGIFSEAKQLLWGLP